MSNGDDQNILNKINAMKNDYYTANTKNLLFKNKQKFDCAQQILQNIDLETLFRTIIRVVDQNKIHFDYNVFKTVMNPSIYMDLIYFIFQVNDKILEISNSYDVFIDMKGLTMTGVERYKDFISLLSEQGKVNGKNFLEKLNHVYIVNPPFMISNIGKILLPLMDKIVKDKIVIQ
jgi:hypothetical protein